MKQPMTIEFTPVGGSENARPNLTVAFHGIMGNITDQVAPVIDTVTRHSSETLLVQAGGLNYDADKLAADTAGEVSARLAGKAFEAVTFMGVSMGGSVAAETIRQLQSNRSFTEYSVTPHATLVDAPSNIADLGALPEKLRKHPHLVRPIAKGVLSALRVVDPLMNKFSVMKQIAVPPDPERFEEGLTKEQIGKIGKEFERMTETPFSVWRAQALSVVALNSPPAGSLDMLGSLSYVHSVAGEDVVIGDSAIRTWGNTVGPDKFSIVHAVMPHAAFSQAPHEANRAVGQAYKWHETRRDALRVSG